MELATPMSDSDQSFVPEHLRPFIAKQDASLYTPMDHASWRFILRISRGFFAQNAHRKYLAGLEETGISTERIPLIEEMDAKLKRFGWRAVPVSGFIPPAVFMEFQSLGILPIACEMRTLEHLAYTPAPDIVHEAAGHAPIIADPEYATYLKAYGEVSRKALFSSQDMALHGAIRALSDIKEDPRSTEADIQAAQKFLDATISAVTYVSEATQLARMNWWTVEYGLVGSLDHPKIYGAGLLSSVGESYSCVKPHVRKIPLTLDCINTLYDITRPQPQLFVAPDFQYLTKVLQEYSKTMAYRVGGSDGLAKALQAATVATASLDSGIQISGVLQEYRLNEKGEVYFLKMRGPTQLAYQDQEIPNQGPEYHKDGFSTAIGHLVGFEKSAADLTDQELRSTKSFEFESGIVITGKFVKSYRQNDKNLILTFEDCTVKKGDEFLFKPEWGTFDLACGLSVVSVFGGAADRRAYVSKTGGFDQKPTNPKCNLTPENKNLNALFSEIRMIREGGLKGDDLLQSLTAIHARLEKEYPRDWLSRIEILELLWKNGIEADWEDVLKSRLLEISKISTDREEMIARGLALLSEELP